MIPNREIEDLFNFILKQYQYNFTEYSQASAKRRVSSILSFHKVNNVYQLIELIQTPEDFKNNFLYRFTVNVTEMYRDPFFYQSIKKNVLPNFKNKPEISVWHPGCSVGEEIISMATLFEAQGILNKTHFLGTDINDKILAEAKKARVKKKFLRDYKNSYNSLSHEKPFEEHYTEDDIFATFKNHLTKNITYQLHDLVNDNVIGKFDMIVCRNLLIYFEPSLQDKVFNLFIESLKPGGYLALGSKESTLFSNNRKRFEAIDKDAKIYKFIN